MVRLGDTVRRPRGPNADIARRLLLHLEQVGFDAAPRFPGSDGQGREVLSFIAGEVPPELGWHEDAVLMEAARLIRRYHDATAPLATAPDEVICHNDLSPCHFVFRDGQPTAMIDFDAAAPGSRAFDLGYAAWLWLDLGHADIGGAEQRRRLELFSAAYGGFDASDLLAAILTRQELLVAEGQRTGNTLTIGWAEACLAWTQQHLVLS